MPAHAFDIFKEWPREISRPVIGSLIVDNRGRRWECVNVGFELIRWQPAKVALKLSLAMEANRTDKILFAFRHKKNEPWRAPKEMIPFYVLKQESGLEKEISFADIREYFTKKLMTVYGHKSI